MSLGETFDFEIIHSYFETAVDIFNLQVVNAPVGENGWDIFLNGVIENPIGIDPDPLRPR